MSARILKGFALTLASVFSIGAFAMEPLVAIGSDDQDYEYYSSVLNLDQNLVNKGIVGIYSDFNMFNVSGRAVVVADGTPSNPYNLVLAVNGNLYYVDILLNSVDSFKIRRRWKNNPEPGVFLRIEGTRVNPEDGRAEVVQVWIKISTPEGRALPVLKLLEGNYDLASAPTEDKLIHVVTAEGPIIPPYDVGTRRPLPPVTLNVGEGNPGPWTGPIPQITNL